MAYCILIRHGRSTANALGVLAGWLEGVDLDETGHEQAADIVRRLEGTPLVHLATSPLDRCRQTAAPLGRAHGLTPQIHHGIGECHYGGWTGRKLADLAEDPLWRTVQDRPSTAAFPSSTEYPGEGIADMAERAVGTVAEIDATVTAEHGTQAVWAAVSHGDIIKSVLAHAAATPLDHFQRWHIDPSSVSVIHFTDTRPMVLRSNDTGITALRPPAPDRDAEASGDAAVGGGAGLGSGS